MTPGRGVGANTALRDAALLCRQLTAVAAGDKTLLRAVADYEAEMLPYGFARVADSLANNGTSGNDPLYRPVVGRFALMAARSYFSLTSRVPPLRRRFIDEIYARRGAHELTRTPYPSLRRWRADAGREGLHMTEIIGELETGSDRREDEDRFRWLEELDSAAAAGWVGSATPRRSPR